VAAFRDHVGALEGQYRTHLDNIKALEAERRGLAQTVEEQIREIRRGTLTAYQQYNDKVREADELTAKARAELAKGDRADLKLAEEFARKALAAAKGLSTAVRDGQEEVVSASTAQATAIRITEGAAKQLNEAINLRIDAEKDAAEAAKQGLDDALPKLRAYEEQLQKVVSLADKGIKLRIEADEAAITKGIADVQKLLSDKFVTTNLLLELKDARAELAKAKEQLAAGIPVDIKPQTQAVEDALNNIRAQKPIVNVDTNAALLDVLNLEGKIKALDQVRPRPKVEIESNVDEVQASIDKLKLPTESTHTVHIKEVRDGGQNGASGSGGTAGGSGTGFARGGLVRAVQRFARGGPVFTSGSGPKVPGTGVGDTVPAILRAGSFVVKKAASQFYGDGMMARLARGVGIRGFAAGGNVTKEEAEKWAKLLPIFGDKNPLGITVPAVTGAAIPKMPDTFQDYGKAPINFDTRPIPDVLLTATNVLSYAREMLSAVGSNNPLLGTLKPQILEGIAAVERSPTDKNALINLLRAAETIGANPYIFAMWGKTTGAGSGTIPIWFVDWLQDRGFDTTGTDGPSSGIPNMGAFARAFLGAAAAKAGPATNILFGGNKKNVNFRFAEGGAPSDTVPAWLTPGEFVFRKSAVARYGLNLMHAINNMAIPRHALAGMLGAPVPVSGYATGGPVGDFATAGGGGRSFREGDVNVTINASAADILSERNIRNMIVPVFDRIAKRKGGSG
jgi:hypothetical protein